MTYSPGALIVAIDAKLALRPRIRLDNLARELQVERHSIEKLIRRVARVSFREYRNEKLLTRALALLREPGSLTVKQIAYILDYRSPGAFTRFVKRATGLTPAQIRRQSAAGG